MPRETTARVDGVNGVNAPVGVLNEQECRAGARRAPRKLGETQDGASANTATFEICYCLIDVI